MIEEAAGQPAVVFIQDYHLALLPKMLKDHNPNLIVAQFWHIPWPNRETFRVFPWKQELLEGMLGNDVLGFHLRYHCLNYLDMADRNLEAVVDMEHSTIRQNGHTTAVRAFPISIDFEAHSQQAQSPAVSKAMNRWSERLGNPDFLGIGVDRIDYTKGLPEKLKGIDLLFHRHPEYAGRLVFAQVGVPSRTAISDYGRLNQQILDFVDELNAKWRRGSWQPVHFIHQHVDMPEMMALHRLAVFVLHPCTMA